MNKHKIMVVDDSALVLDVVGETLRVAGYEVITRSHAIGTGAAILRERPVLALLDVSMPLMTGAEISDGIRSRAFSPSTWIVLHSDRPEAELRKLVQDCGADGYLRKTSDANRLLAEVQAWVARGRPRAGAAGDRSGARYILVACDPRTRERLSRELTTSFDVRFTESGAEAVRVLCSKQVPALALVGTSIADVACSAVYRAACRSDPAWRGRFIVIDENDDRAARELAELAELPVWSKLDPVVTLGAQLALLGTRS